MTGTGGLRGGRPRLLRADTPAAPVAMPRQAAAELAWSDGTWRPVTVRGWARPDGGYRTIMDPGVFEWLVLLEFASGVEGSGWYCYEPGALRPAS